MRLSVFTVDTLSTQLIIDLQKIYSNIWPAASLTAQALNNIFITNTAQLFVTMFNERHIGSVKITIESEEATLSLLCVRDITRRRGIGKNLLKQVEKTLVENGLKGVRYDLTEIPSQHLLSTQAFLSDSGYCISGNMAEKEL